MACLHQSCFFFSIGDGSIVVESWVEDSERDSCSEEDGIGLLVSDTLSVEEESEGFFVGWFSDEESEEVAAVGEGVLGDVPTCGVARRLEFFFITSE